MNANELKCLKYLAKDFHHYEGGTYSPFAPIAKATRLKRSKVRLACRSLTRKGLAKFGKGLSDHDGEFRGSGYSATEQGVSFVGVEEL